MTGVRLELASLDDYFSPKDYVERHLAPIATELHRIANELMVPGSTAEELSVDMTVTDQHGEYFRRLDKRLDESPKHVVFDGSQYFSLPKDVLKSKQVKVQFAAVLYLKAGTEADFRLVRDDGMTIQGSLIRVRSRQALTYHCTLPLADAPGCISPDSRTYYIEAGTLDRLCLPVCRRFSLSFVYI